MVAELEQGIGGDGLGQCLVRRVDQDPGIDLALAAAQIPRGEAQHVDAVGQRRGIDGRQRLDAAGADRFEVGIGQHLPRRIVDRAAIGRRDLELPSHELEIGHARLQQSGLRQRRRLAVQRGPGQRAGPGQRRRRRVQRITHADLLVLRADEAIRVGDRHADVDQARRAGRELEAAGGVDRDGLPVAGADRGATHLHGRRCDLGEAAGADGRQHGLARKHRGRRRQVDQDARRVRARISEHAQREALRDGVEAIADLREDDEIADLAGARRPAEATRGGVVARAFRQVAERHDERLRLRRAVGIADAQRPERRRPRLDDIEAEVLAHQQRMAAGVDLRRLIDVLHAHLHGTQRRGHSVRRGEREAEGMRGLDRVVDA